MKNEVIFIAGTYGVGKSTLCNNLSLKLGIPAFSAGDLISEVNGETYGRNKAVKDKNANQEILISAIKKKLVLHPSLLLAGHFCIFSKNTEVEILPEFIYEKMPITKIILLETDAETVSKNLKLRDNKSYSHDSIERLIDSERNQAKKISLLLNIPLYIHQMCFSEIDTEQTTAMIQGSVI